MFKKQNWPQKLFQTSLTYSVYVEEAHIRNFYYLFLLSIYNSFFFLSLKHSLGFPGSSTGKEPAYNAGDPSLIPGLGSSPGGGTGDSLQYSWASLLDQMVKNPPAMQETWVRSLGWEDLLEESMATHSSFLAWRIPVDRGAWQAIFRGVTKSWTQLSD